MRILLLLVMLSSICYAEPKLEVTGLVIGKNIKAIAILNDRIVKEGDFFEVVDGKYLGDKLVGVKHGSNTLLIKKITKDGVLVFYVEGRTYYSEKLITLKEKKDAVRNKKSIVKEK